MGLKASSSTVVISLPSKSNFLSPSSPISAERDTEEMPFRAILRVSRPDRPLNMPELFSINERRRLPFRSLKQFQRLFMQVDFTAQPAKCNSFIVSNFFTQNNVLSNVLLNSLHLTCYGWQFWACLVDFSALPQMSRFQSSEDTSYFYQKYIIPKGYIIFFSSYQQG